MKRPQVKICGVTRSGDARTCADLGADMIGLNFWPGSSRFIAPPEARRIVEELPDRVRAVGVFVDATAEHIRQIARASGVRAIQVHGNVGVETCRELASEFHVVRALRTDDRFAPQDAAAWPECDLLLDSDHPQLRGGTGLTCDWEAARATLPFTRFLILSGGLDERNVGAAISAVSPHAVDVCSGVELRAGIKDRDAVARFIAAVQATESVAS